METLMIEVDNKEKATILKSFLKELNFVSNIKTVNNKTDLIEALGEHEYLKKAIVKKKNPIIAKYL